MRYALIHGYTGVVYYVCDAANPKQACEICDQDIDGEVVAYESRARQNSSEDFGYHVHEAPAGWDCADGTDEEEIEKVGAMPYCGFYSPAGREEEC